MNITDLLEKLNNMEDDFTDPDLKDIEWELKHIFDGNRGKETKDNLIKYLKTKTQDKDLYKFALSIIDTYKEIRDDFDKMGPVSPY